MTLAIHPKLHGRQRLTRSASHTLALSLPGGEFPSCRPVVMVNAAVRPTPGMTVVEAVCCPAEEGGGVRFIDVYW